MIRKLSEKLKVMRTDRPDEWTMDELLRDAVKLEKERDEALAKLAAMEGQEPEPYDAGFLNDFGGGNVGWWHDYIRAELDRAHDHYAQQFTIPADKPAVAVPDNFNGDNNKLVECATALLDLDAEGALVPHGLGGHARTIIESFVSRTTAPSHSQQSAEQIDGWKIALKVREALDRKACPDAFMKIAVEEIERLLCAAPSPQPAECGSRQAAEADRLREFADEIKQLCSDFSDRQNRPYMGDVTAAIDGLYEQFNRCPSHESEQGKSIDDLPGMWCESDLSGGWADSCNQKTEGE